MHKFIDKFDEINTRYIKTIKEKELDNYPDEDYLKIPSGNEYILKSKYYTDERHNPIPICIVDNDTTKIIESKYHICSVYFTKVDTKYNMVGSVFRDTKQLRDVLELLKSKEVK